MEILQIVVTLLVQYPARGEGGCSAKFSAGRTPMLGYQLRFTPQVDHVTLGQWREWRG
jgi:hypothetical protein